MGPGTHDPSALGLTLQLLRQRQGLSINGLGRESGVDAAYIWRLERGEKQDPSLSVLRRLAMALGLSPQEFLSRLIAVEGAMESGQPIVLDSLATDGDEAIFAELLSERAQKQTLRAASGIPWNVVPLPSTKRIPGAVEVPFRGRIAAGEPTLVETGDEDHALKTSTAALPDDPELFALEVSGDSMVGAGISSGDRVLVSPALASTMVGGQIAVCRLFGSELTLKYLWLTDSGYLLRAANPQYPDREVPRDQCEILGVVVRILGSARSAVDSKPTPTRGRRPRTTALKNP